MPKKVKAGIDLGLSDEDKSTLHKIALTSIKNRLKSKETSLSTPDSKILQENRGAFVSLHRRGKLRGCIGFIQGVKPLYQTIHEMSMSAAFQDPRFEPLKEKELEDLEIEISVLTPLKQVSDINEIEIGKHGLMIVKEPYSGLLLPQVATEYGWDRETFLNQTCMKAGLPEGSWVDKDTKILAFSADVF